MPKRSSPKPDTPAVAEDGALAVSCLRVSTKEQAQRGGRDEGFSLPAQREASQRKAGSLNAAVVEEFTEPGESGTTTDRPALQRLLAYVKARPVAYCIVHKIDRLARNRLDDAMIRYELRQIRTIEVDPDRSEHLTWAFRAYASGNWTTAQIYEELIARGLTTVPTPRHPAKPLAFSPVHRMLANPSPPAGWRTRRSSPASTSTSTPTTRSGPNPPDPSGCCPIPAPKNKRSPGPTRSAGRASVPLEPSFIMSGV
jgi:hypothetical protein